VCCACWCCVLGVWCVYCVKKYLTLPHPLLHIHALSLSHTHARKNLGFDVTHLENGISRRVLFSEFILPSPFAAVFERSPHTIRSAMCVCAGGGGWCAWASEKIKRARETFSRSLRPPPHAATDNIKRVFRGFCNRKFFAACNPKK
jgi:hypothetical protein